MGARSRPRRPRPGGRRQPRRGSTLTAGNGNWSNGPTSYGYQWQRLAAAGWEDIDGETGATYMVTSDDLGRRLRVTVVATNPDGSATAASDPTAPVGASGVNRAASKTSEQGQGEDLGQGQDASKKKKAAKEEAEGQEEGEGQEELQAPVGHNAGMAESLRGKLILASPVLRDPNFVRTVVLIAEHTDEGAMGLVLNRPADSTVGEAVPGPLLAGR